MSLRVVGAGVGRTGTASLQLALQTLLGGRCYHMLEVFDHPDHVPLWHQALLGDPPDWNLLFDGYVAAVDWPAAACWRELTAAYPDAIVLLSTRSSSETWWRSADATIIRAMRVLTSERKTDWDRMAVAMMDRFGPGWQAVEGAVAAYERHNAEVRVAVDPDRLVEWQPGDGWGPLCAALDLPEPDEPFPHTNTTEEFRARAGWQ